jgi:hypothetical protein
MRMSMPMMPVGAPDLRALGRATPVGPFHAAAVRPSTGFFWFAP